MSRFTDKANAGFDMEPPDDYDPAVDCWCQICGIQYNGSDSSGGHHTGGRFGGCCQSFHSLTAFDRHLMPGRYEKGARICRTPEELVAKGWTLDGTAWRLPAPKDSPWKR